MEELNKITTWGQAIDKLNFLNSKAAIKLTASYNTPVTTTYTKILGTFSNVESANFGVDGNKVICQKAGTYVAAGTSNYAMLTNNDIEGFYSMFKNGVDIGAVTRHTFSLKNKYENISITGLLKLEVGDYIEIFGKASASDTMQIDSLSVILFAQ